MMNKPAVVKLMGKTENNRYELVCDIAKRARQLNEGADAFVDDTDSKPIATAIKELEEDKIYFAEPEKDELFGN
ncbi:MAG: DNA-directed RNA polymerase subunit omega [Eubacteriales bacterium]|nr:DNA-directed RNA polymerase subunit omega [Eubacteriales bacterium]